MNVRNLLKPADYVIPVPVGVPIELEYDQKGNLSKIYSSIQYSNDEGRSFQEVWSSNFFELWKSNKLSPVSVPIQGGTTRVYGVLLGPVFSGWEGMLPECMVDRICESLSSKEQYEFKFYAYRVVSYATNFSRSYTALRWLSMSGFDVLDGYLMPASIRENEEFFSKILCKVSTPSIPVFFAVYRMSDCFIYSNYVRQVIIQGCNLYQSVIGEVWVTASSLSMESVFMFDYREASKYNLADGDVIWVDSSNKIVYSYPHEGSKSNYYTNTCPRCGGPLEPTFRGMQCKDENCVSRIYPRICHMLDTLKIPPLSVERFKELVEDDKILYVLDVFSLPEYKDVKVSCNIASVLFSLAPQRMANDFLRSDIQYFVNKCNNNLTTVIYYIEHLTAFKNNSVYPDSSSFFVFLEWLNEPENLLMFKNLLSVKQVSIDETVRRFEGAPIFRNRKFLLTGTFSHGTLDDVRSILRSYSAAILDDFSDEISAVIVGDILEDVRGEWIQEARYRDIPVITESKLFRDHKIDEDLSALNLL